MKFTKNAAIKKGELCELECLRNDVQYFEGTRNVHILNMSRLHVDLHTNVMLHYIALLYTGPLHQGTKAKCKRPLAKITRVKIMLINLDFSQ